MRHGFGVVHEPESGTAGQRAEALALGQNQRQRPERVAEVTDAAAVGENRTALASEESVEQPLGALRAVGAAGEAHPFSGDSHSPAADFAHGENPDLGITGVSRLDVFPRFVSERRVAAAQHSRAPRAPAVKLKLKRLG